jgi:serine/threonine protein kinase
MARAADRNLLFGILALQMDVINRDQLIDAMHQWVADQERSLGEILVAAHAMDDELCRLLGSLMDKRIERHNGDVQKSLGSFASLGSSLKEQLLLVDNPDITQTVMAIPSSRWSVDRTVGEFSGVRRFSIVHFHAKGGLGEVYVAEDRELSRNVALKMITGEFADRPDCRSRFVAEAEVTAGLEHPNIVPVYGLGLSDDGRPYYAMKFIHGESLRERINEYHQRVNRRQYTAKEQSLALRALLGHLVDTCQAVEYAHTRGVIHRDLKPANVMLGRYGETLVVDWGLAKAVGRGDQQRDSQETTLRPSSRDGSSETVSGRPLGTLPYASPEQITGQLDELGPASDVYSLGATLFVILTGEPPFKGTQQEIVYKVKAGAFPRPRKLKPQVSPALEAICLKAMAYKPENRYRSPSSLAAEINAWLADEAVEAYDDPMLTSLRRWVKRHRVLAAGLVTAVVVALAGLATGTALLSAKNSQLADLNTELDQTNSLLEARNDELTAVNAEIQEQNDQIRDQNREIQQQRDEIAAQRDKVQENYESATRLTIDLATRRGQWEEALTTINRAIAEGHHDPVALRLEKVRALYGLIRTEECSQEVESLYKLTDKAGHDAAIELWRGDMMLLKHDPGPAQDLIESAIARGLPPDEESYAQALLEENTSDAVRHLQTTIEQNSFHQRAYHYLIANLIMLGRRDEAREKILIGRVLFPDDGNFELLMAWLLAMGGDAEASVKALQEIRPILEDEDYQLAERLFQGVARYVRTMDHWEKALGLQDVYWLFRLTTDFRAISTTGIRSGKSGFPLSLEFRPAGSAITAYMTLLRMLDWKTALTFHIDANVGDELLESAKLHPDGFLYFISGQIFLVNNEAEKSRDAFAMASKLPALIPNVDREALYCLCMTHQMVFLKTGDESELDEALVALRRRLEYGALTSAHAGNVLNLCLRRNELELARTIIHQQLVENPDNADWQMRLADVERRDGNLLRAIRLAEQVVENDPAKDDAEKFRAETIRLLSEAMEDLPTQGEETQEKDS